MKSFVILCLLTVRALASPTTPFVDVENESIEKRQFNALSRFLGFIVELFPVNIAVDGLSDLITKGEAALAIATGTDTTENDLERGRCADVAIIFARGTTEAGNVGVLAGPPFFDAVRRRMDRGVKLAVQGVDYPADIAGFLEGGDKEGSQEMANLVSGVIRDCPQSKVVMSGYSQGGQLVHNAAKLLPQSTMDAVSSVVIFGDPNFGEPVEGAAESKTIVICHEGDNICEGGNLILLPHLTYARDANQAASFVIANAGAIGS